MVFLSVSSSLFCFACMGFYRMFGGFSRERLFKKGGKEMCMEREIGGRERVEGSYNILFSVSFYFSLFNSKQPIEK